MKKILFEAVKLNAKYWVKHNLTGANMTPELGILFLNKIREGSNTHSHIAPVIVEVAKEAHKIIDAWDIRCVNHLIKLSAEFQPKWLQGRFTIDMDENANWALYAA